MAPRVLCKHSKHLNVLVQEVIDDGGEGVIMRKVGSLYEHGRSPNLIKLKVSLLCLYLYLYFYFYLYFSLLFLLVLSSLFFQLF